MKRKNPQDERIVFQRRKIQSDAFGIIFFVLLISVLIQQILFGAPFEQFAVELICFLGMSVYIFIRNLAIGNNLFGDGKRAKVMPLVNSLVTGIVATSIHGVLNYSRYSEHYDGNIGLFIAVLAIFFISTTVSVFAAISFLIYLNRKKQMKIQEQLDNNE